MKINSHFCQNKLLNRRGHIFDLDGTLVDSKLDFNKMREEIGVPGQTPVLEYLESHEDEAFVKRGLDIVRAHELRGAQQATWIEGAKEFLDFLNRQNIPTAILTRNSKKVTEMTIKSLDIPISFYLTRDDCRPKPDPEGLHLISQRWGISSDELMYFGDFHFDLVTAKAAKMPFAFYIDQSGKGGKRKWQSCNQAEVVFGDYQALQEFFQKNLSLK